MKATFLPVYFDGYYDEEFKNQFECVKELLCDEAAFLPPQRLGDSIPKCDAVVFFVLNSMAYKNLDNFKNINVPILIVTSEFGTVSMWDWEIVCYLRSNGIKVFAPYKIEYTKTICKALALKRDMNGTKFIVFQDNPGEGMQPEIFKRFIWWEQSWIDTLYNKFGITIEKRSFQKLGEKAKNISDSDADTVIAEKGLNYPELCTNQLRSAIKMYIALCDEINDDSSVKAIGINCLNESRFSDTTPCLAYELLFKEKGIVWGCEADTISMLTEYVVLNTLNQPAMMTNIYPFLIGMTALKHEKITEFPKIDNPDDCMLLVHCGYMGYTPECMTCKHKVTKKVLEIVDDNAIVVDAELEKGDVTLVKFHPTLEKLQAYPCRLEEYVQYPGSDCRNGAIIRTQNGHKFIKNLFSHHGCFTKGDVSVELSFVAEVLNLDIITE